MGIDMDADENIKKDPVPETVWDLMYLTACALRERQPDPDRLARMDLPGVYKLAVKQSLAAATCMALEGTDAFAAADPALQNSWTEEKNRVIRKNMMLNAERTRILEDMEQAGIWYLPLKGNIIQDLYPKFGMRQSTDVDILYDRERQKDLTALMSRRGYETVSVGKWHHDVYTKPPVYNFEMHTTLLEKTAGRLYEYYMDVKDRLLPLENTRYGFRFREEDFYIYIMAHGYAHYRNGGIGLRILADHYVYWQAKCSKLDHKYIKETLGRLGIEDFEKTIRVLSEKLFGGEFVSEDRFTGRELALLAECASVGTYGTEMMQLKKRMEELHVPSGNPGFREKMCYMWKRLFPDREWIRQHAPFVGRHGILIPFYIVFRLFRRLIFYRKGLIKELRTLKKMKK